MSGVSSNFMVYAGAHFKTCPIELREAWSLIAQPEIVHEFLSAVTGQNVEFVNIGTCNRFDICVFAKVTQAQVLQFFDLVAKRFYEKHPHSLKIPFEQITQVIQIDFDDKALTRLFKVTASLDSLVLGEQQILGQMKSAFAQCVKLGHARVAANHVFSHCFKVAKKIRFETDLGKNSVSIGHAALAMSLQIFNSLADKKVLIVGAGEMAKIVAKNILGQKPHSLSIANRTYSRAENLCQEMIGTAPLSLSLALENIHQFDVCVFAASGDEFLLNMQNMRHYEKLRQGKLSVFIDISVPRKIDPLINEMDNIFLFHVDDLDLVMEQNRSKRKAAAAIAAAMIEKEVRLFLESLEQKENLKSVGHMHQWLTGMVQYEVERYLYDASRGKHSSPNVIGDAVAKKIISHSASLARQNSKLEGAPYCVSEMLEFLFKVSTQPDRKFRKKINCKNVIPLKRKISR